MFESRGKQQSSHNTAGRVISKWKKIGYTPIFLPLFRPRLKSSQLMDISTRLAAMTEAGLPVTASLRFVSHEARGHGLKKVLETIAAQVEAGISLSAAFRQQNHVFPTIFIRMIQAGENSGKLDVALQRLSVHFEKQHNLEQNIKSATAYPKIIAGVLVLVVLFLFSFVVPRFESVFFGMGAELPLLTRTVLFLGQIGADHWHLFILSLILLFLAYRLALKTEKGIYAKDRLFFFIPYVNGFYRKTLMAKFCRTLGTMLSSGVDLLLALELAGQVTDNRVFEMKIAQSKKWIVQGSSVADALARTDCFPPMVLGLVHTGEQTGTLETLLGKSASFYEQDVEHTLNRLGTILEPALILFMAIIVGLVVISVLLPMFELFTYI